MARIAAQEMTADLFGPQGTAFMQMMGDRHQLARQRRNAPRLFLRGGGFRRASHRCQQFRLCGPACSQGRIEAHRAGIGAERLVSVPTRPREMPRFLPGAPVFGHFGMQPLQKGSRRIVPVQIARRDRRDIERIAILRILRQQRFGTRQPSGEIAALQGFLGCFQLVAVIAHA